MCDCSVDRRIFLGGTIGGFFAYAMTNGMDSLFAQESQGAAKRIVVLWMDGGPSQIDTFDPKPGQDTGGEFKAIDTAVRGMRISQHLPEIAMRMKHLSILRSLTSKEGDHFRGQYLMHTGWTLVDGFARPSAGAVISKETPARKFPKYVTIGSSGFGPAFMGPDHAPFAIEDPDRALQTLRAIERRSGDLKLMRELGKDFEEKHSSGLLDRRKAVVTKIEELVDTPFVKALDLNRESEKSRRRYGDGAFGRGCLLARRLLHVGVNYVEVRQGGWDTHNNNFDAVRNLSRAIDAPWAALMDDLDAEGLLKDTMVLWMGEFGRTPNINANNGRDHYPAVTSAVIGGGGIPGGLVVGETNRLGTAIASEPVQVADLFATIFARFGIDPGKVYRNEFGGTAEATDKGRSIAALR